MERTNLEKPEDKEQENFFISYNDLREGKDKLLEKIRKYGIVYISIKDSAPLKVTMAKID